MSAAPDELAQRAEDRPNTPSHAAQDCRHVCLVGLGNLPVLAREYSHHGIGGEQVQQTLLAKAFVRSGYRVSMVTADYGQPDGRQWDGITVYKAYAPDAGIPLVRFFHPRWSGTWSALKRANADVYYISCSSPHVGWLAMYCRQYGKQFIFRVASDADCAPEKLLMKHWRDRKLYEFGLKRAAGVLVQSRQQQRMLERNYGVSSSLAGMLVDAGSAARQFTERDLTVLWVSNIIPLKRPDLLLQLADSAPELSFHMAGGAVGRDGAFYESTKEAAHSRRNVNFLGRVPYHESIDLYGRARVFVNTSDIEGFPNSYLQAWSAGVPVVAFFDPDGLIATQGLGIAARNPEELSEAVRHLAQNEAAWTEVSNRCRAFMKREYGEQSILAPYRKLIDSLASPGLQCTAGSDLPGRFG